MGATLSSLSSTAERGWLDPVDRNQFTYMTFCCRCDAIDTLYKVKIRSASGSDNEQWTPIFDMISTYDEMCDKTLQELESSANGYPSIFERIEKVSNAFDTGLLSYLQAKVDLMGELGDYLPEKGQSWEEFLKDMNTDCEEENLQENVQDSAGLEVLKDMNTDCEEENLQENVQDSAGLEVLKDMNTDCEEENNLQNVQASAGLEALKTFKKLTTRLMSAIEGDVKKNGVLQSVQKEKKIKVFYATNRRTSEGHYTSERGECLLYGFQQVIIPSAHERGNDPEHFVLEAKWGPWKESDKFLKEIEREFDSERAIPPHNGHSANDVASATGGPQKVRVHKQ
jgi:hypothetical protein